MAIKILKPMPVHEPMVLRFTVDRSPPVIALRAISSTFSQLSEDRYTSTSYFWQYHKLL
jgi:hypothetical protein